MWIDFKIETSGIGNEPVIMHFVSDATVDFDIENKKVTIEYEEPSEDENENIKARLFIDENMVQIVREGSYVMEQSFETNVMTTGVLELPEAKLELNTTTTKYKSDINFTNKSGEINLEYTMYIQGEYSGDFKWDLSFYINKTNEVLH